MLTDRADEVNYNYDVFTYGLSGKNRGDILGLNWGHVVCMGQVYATNTCWRMHATIRVDPAKNIFFGGEGGLDKILQGGWLEFKFIKDYKGYVGAKLINEAGEGGLQLHVAPPWIHPWAY